MSLFQGEFLFLHSGQPTDFKIDCDYLTDDDLNNLAKIATKSIQFGKVYGIPKGGERFAKALEKYESPTVGTMLIVDDVLTTGSSFKQYRRLLEKQCEDFYLDNSLGTEKRSFDIKGLCIFCRIPENKPSWVKSIFDMEIHD